MKAAEQHLNKTNLEQIRITTPNFQTYCFYFKRKKPNIKHTMRTKTAQTPGK